MAKLSVHLKSGLLLIVLVRCVSSNGEQEILTEATPTETMENVMTTTIFATTIAETTRSTYGFSIVEPTTTVEPTTRVSTQGAPPPPGGGCSNPHFRSFKR